jgi:uncharacterized protein (DUF433 family)
MKADSPSVPGITNLPLIAGMYTRQNLLNNVSLYQSLKKIMNWKDHISSEPTVLFGKMVIKGTRVPVELILEKLANGFSMDELAKAYPRLTAQDIQACLLFAAENARHEKTLAIAG